MSTRKISDKRNNLIKENVESASDIKIKHEESQKIFPEIDLDENEFVVNEIPRDLIGLLPRIIIGGLIILISLIIIFSYSSIIKLLNLSGTFFDNIPVVFTIFMAIIALTLVWLYVEYYIFINNQFFLTNESIVEYIQTGLFKRFEQTISLKDIEDASFTQDGLIRDAFNYGAIRLSTIGDETTYRFDFVSDPKKQIAILNDAIEDYKNGRPVEEDH